MSRRTRRAAVVAAFALALMTAPFVSWQGATGGEHVAASRLAPRGIVVVGDSITALYNDRPGTARQGWWSIVGRHFDADVATYAQSGSGYLRPGRGCTGNRFIDREAAFTGAAPSLVIIEGGRNDWATCDKGRYVIAPNAVIAGAVNRYLDTLQTFLPASTRIVVMGPPWGPLDPYHGGRITSIVQTAAHEHGLEFIDTSGVLTAGRVVDGVHPNLRGNRALARRVIDHLER